MQTCLDSMQKTLEEKESLLAKLETRLQEVQDKALRADKAAAASMSSIQQRHAAVEERARLAEQVLAPPHLHHTVMRDIQCLFYQ